MLALKAMQKYSEKERLHDYFWRNSVVTVAKNLIRYSKLVSVKKQKSLQSSALAAVVSYPKQFKIAKKDQSMSLAMPQEY